MSATVYYHHILFLRHAQLS